MGLVVFQFHLSFAPSHDNKRHVLACRQRLQANITMAVEFRNRGWFKGEAACWLLGSASVACRLVLQGLVAVMTGYPVPL